LSEGWPAIIRHAQGRVKQSKATSRGKTRWLSFASAIVEARLEQYRVILQEAGDQWERSKLDGMERASDFGRPGRPINPRTKKPMGRATMKLVKVKETVTRTGRLGEPRYLHVALDCLKEMSKLEGLYPEKVTRVKGMTTSSSQDFWDMLAVAVQGADEDPIEEEIKRAELEHQQAVAAPAVEQADGDGHE
jgi:hypothetical protein